mmetsp:Transcript_30578/g.64695  ORF Transcript_30578/g.64695 Transcript_30578/m.64695 type:complete len:82 (+) Transcript_30578:1775-2020(+)
MPAPIVTLQRFAYAPSNDVFFSRSSNGRSLDFPPTFFFIDDGLKKGDFGIGGALPVPDTAVAVVEFMIFDIVFLLECYFIK